MTKHVTGSLAASSSRLSIYCSVSVVAWLAALLIFAGPAPAQAKNNGRVRVQPHDLKLGSLRKGTHVEAHVVVFWNDKSKAQKPVKIEPPSFVRVMRSKTIEQEHLGATTRIWIAIATQELGAVAGNLAVRCDGVTVKVAVEAVVLPNDPISTRVLVAKTPFDGFSANDSSLLKAWRGVVDTGKLEVNYLNAPEKGPVFGVKLLQIVDVVVVADSCLVGITKQDVALLQGFVCGGGRLVVAADHFFEGTVAKANELVTAFGMRMHDTEPRGLASYELADDEIAKDRITDKVTSIRVRRPSPISITDNKRARMLVQFPGVPEQAFLAVARTESGGEVVAIGKSLWWFWARSGKGNARLLRNVLMRRRRPPVQRK